MMLAEIRKRISVKQKKKEDQKLRGLETKLKNLENNLNMVEEITKEKFDKVAQIMSEGENYVIYKGNVQKLKRMGAIYSILFYILL
jgi:hypothetical protein